MQALLVLSVVIMIAALSLLFGIAGKIEEENRMLEAGIQTSRIYNEELQKKIGEIRRFRHDAAGLLQAIDAYGLDAGGELPGHRAVLDESRAAEAAAMPLLDAVIELKRRQCAEAGMEFDCPESLAAVVGRGADCPDETDLCLLMQNLLDNAYEANLRIDDKSQRMMRLEAAAAEAGTGLTISVTNRVDAGEKVSFLTRKSQAELHGIGLRIVDDILKKYDGSREVRTDSARHILTTTVRMNATRTEAN